METATTQPAKNKLNENPNKQQVTEKIFSNPNYNPEKWFDRPRQEIGTTGIEVVDAANNLREKICIDALTGVFNRSYYDRLKTTFDVSRVKDASLAIVFVD
jgi:PleD family two-component response regulator